MTFAGRGCIVALRILMRIFTVVLIYWRIIFLKDRFDSGENRCAKKKKEERLVDAWFINSVGRCSITRLYAFIIAFYSTEANLTALS